VIVTVPLAEASEQGKALAVCEMGSLVEIMVVSGAVDQRAPLEWAAGAVRWIARVGYIGQGETNARLETGGFPSANPVLLHWSSLLADAWIRALPDRRIHLVAPAVACIVYRADCPANGGWDLGVADIRPRARCRRPVV